MKKNELYQGEVTRLKFPNKGMVKVEGEEELVMVKIHYQGRKSPFD